MASATANKLPHGKNSGKQGGKGGQHLQGGGNFQEGVNHLT